MKPTKYAPSLNRSARQIGAVSRPPDVMIGVGVGVGPGVGVLSPGEVVGMSTLLGWSPCVANIFATTLTLETPTMAQQRFLKELECSGTVSLVLGQHLVLVVI